MPCLRIHLCHLCHLRMTFRTELRHMQLQNYAAGQWVAGSGKQADLIDAITGTNDFVALLLHGGDVSDRA